MTKPTIDELLAESAPRARSSEPGVQSALRAVAIESRGVGRARRRTRSRLWWLATPVVAVPLLVVATTGSSDDGVVPDFTIPISYTTDTGREISCSMDFFNGESNNVETSTIAVDYLRAQDWTGIGQRLYDRALVYENDQALLYEGAGGPIIENRRDAWAKAETELLAVPEGLLDQSNHYAGTAHCTGELH